MKKTFKINEIVRLKNTLVYGVVEAQFSDTEYFCTFDSVTKKYTSDELSYGVFKQLLKWLSYADSLTQEEVNLWIEKVKSKYKLNVILKYIIYSIALFFVLIVFFIIF